MLSVARVDCCSSVRLVSWGNRLADRYGFAYQSPQNNEFTFSFIDQFQIKSQRLLRAAPVLATMAHNVFNNP